MNTLQKLRHRIRTHGNILARRWYLVVLSIVCMLPVLYSAHAAGGVFYSHADVLFLPPPASVGGNSLRADPGRTVYYAAIVERQFNSERPDNIPRPTSAPLYGTGIQDGYAVYLPNAGGQWQSNFNKPALTVEVVGKTSSEVQKNMDQIVQRIQELARVPQKEMGIKSGSFIATELSPEKPSISYVGIRSSRAEGALVLLTIGIAIGVAHLGDGLISHFSRKRGLALSLREQGAVLNRQRKNTDRLV